MFTVSHSGLNPRSLTPQAVLCASSSLDFQDLMQNKGSSRIMVGQVLAHVSSYCALFLRLICSGGTVYVT